jgi:putative heme iron utilization protein
VSGPFSPEVVEAVRRHMDEDHRDDSLLIVRSLGGVPEATSATMSGLDEAGALFVAGTAEGERTVRVPWSAPIAERAQIRAEVVRMYHEACEALGVEPRAAGEH